MSVLKIQQDPGRIGFATEEVIVTVGTGGVTLGNVVKFEWNSGYADTVVATTTSDVDAPNLIFGVAMATASAGDEVRVVVRGQVKVNCAVNMNAGILGILSNSSAGRLVAMTLDPTDAASTRTKPLAISTAATDSAGDLTEVIFDGITGIAAVGN
jgi:hypothetical protein